MNSTFILVTIVAISSLAFAEDISGPSPNLAQLKQHATELEKDGNAIQAAELYEQIVTLDPPSQTVLANRLAFIYAEAGYSNKALHWASIAAKINPDPPAYMAGIHSKLGDDQTAIKIIEKEIAKEERSSRTLALYWQLADIYEKIESLQKADLTLQTSVSALLGSPQEEAARKRLETFRKKYAHGMAGN